MELQLDSDKDRVFIENEPDEDGEYQITIHTDGVHESEYKDLFFTKEQIIKIREHFKNIK